jgi:hypothetical protein
VNRSWSDRRGLAAVLLWIPSTLWLDTFASPLGQLALGAVTWALLLVWLWHETRLVRAQTAVVVLIAACIELVFSGWLGTYVYRLEHVPAYVFPGHGLVYLAAFTFAPPARRTPELLDGGPASRWSSPARGRCGALNNSRLATTCSALLLVALPARVPALGVARRFALRRRLRDS